MYSNESQVLSDFGDAMKFCYVPQQTGQPILRHTRRDGHETITSYVKRICWTDWNLIQLFMCSCHAIMRTAAGYRGLSAIWYLICHNACSATGMLSEQPSTASTFGEPAQRSIPQYLSFLIFTACAGVVSHVVDEALLTMDEGEKAEFVCSTRDWPEAKNIAAASFSTTEECQVVYTITLLAVQQVTFATSLRMDMFTLHITPCFCNTCVYMYDGPQAIQLSFISVPVSLNWSLCITDNIWNHLLAEKTVLYIVNRRFWRETHRHNYSIFKICTPSIAYA